MNSGKHFTRTTLTIILLSILLLTQTAYAAPTVSIDSPQGNDVVGGSSVTINGTSSNATTIYLNFTNSSLGTTWKNIKSISGPSSWSTTWDTTGIADGSSYKINATAENITGATVSNTTNTFTVDNTDPDVPSSTVLDPNGGENVSGSSYTVTWDDGNISDSNLGSDPIDIEYYDGSSWKTIVSGTANNGSHDWNPLPSNIETTSAKVNITATDQAGNSASDESNSTFLLDTKAPSVPASNLNPSDGATTSDQSPTISANYSDDGSGINTSTVKLFFDGADVTPTSPGSTGVSYQASNLNYGTTHNVTLNVTDYVGNKKSVNWTFTVQSSGSGVYTGERIWNAANNPPLYQKWNYNSFGGFYYSFTSGLGMENMTLDLDGYGDRTVEKGDLTYETSTADVSFDVSDWGKYRVVGFMGKKYFAGYSSSIGKNGLGVDKSLLKEGSLSKVLMDDDEGRNIPVGTDFDLKDGYELRTTEVDVSGDTAWIELYKDGSVVESDVKSSGETFIYKKSVGGVDEVPVVAVKVGDVFRGTESSIVTYDGVFQISDSTDSVESGETFGKMEVSSKSNTGLKMENDEEFKLSRGDSVNIFGDVDIVVADSSTLRFAPTDTEQDQFRGTISSGANKWTVDSFEGFYYDLDEDIGSETLEVKSGGRTISSDQLVYNTNSKKVSFDYSSWGKFKVVGFMAEKYFAGYTSDPGFTDGQDVMGEGFLSRVLMDTDEQKTVYQGDSVGIGDGYALKFNEVDTAGETVMMELYKDGEKVSGSTSIVGSGESYTYEKDVEGIDNFPLIAAHVDSVFRGGESSAVVINGIFQVSENFKNVETGSTFGKMEVTSTTSTSLEMKNDDEVDLGKGSTVNVMGDLSFKVADTGSLKYAPVSPAQKQGSGSDQDTEVTDTPEPDEPLKINASPGKVRVEGTVTITVTSGGDAVEGVTVYVNADSVGKTGSDGRVLYTPHSEGTFQVTASKDGYEEASTTFQASKSGIFIDKPSLIVAGKNFTLRFTEQDGTPLRDVTVKIDGSSIGTTDSDGEITHTLYKTGVFSLEANKDGFNALVTDLKVSDESRIEINDVIALDPKITAGKPARFKVVVRNPGETVYNDTIEMKVDGKNINFRQVELKPGEIKSIDFEYRFESDVLGSPKKKEQTVSFNGVEKKVTVETDSTRKTSIIGGLVALLIASIGGLYYFLGQPEVDKEIDEVLEKLNLRERIDELRGKEGEDGDEIIGLEEDLEEGDSEGWKNDEE